MAALTHFRRKASAGVLAAAVAVLTIGLMWAQAGSQKATSEGELALARDYVLAACLIQKYPGTPIAEEAEIWAEGLVERGDIEAELYADLAELARSGAPQPLNSRSGKPMLLQSCLEFYNSSVLKDAVSRLLKK